MYDVQCTMCCREVVGGVSATAGGRERDGSVDDQLQPNSPPLKTLWQLSFSERVNSFSFLIQNQPISLILNR